LAKGIASTAAMFWTSAWCPPGALFCRTAYEGRSGVMITGSHNPADYNGLKMSSTANAGWRQDQKLKQCIDNQAFATGEAGTIEQNSRLVNEYIGTVSEDIHIARPMKVVWIAVTALPAIWGRCC